MMYLLFFGKSQSFTYEAFNLHGHFPEFDALFPGFEALESKMLTIDRRENPSIWARYRLKNQAGKVFSVLKVYRFAQAFDSSRVLGSTYGVALVSEQDLLWDPINLDILEAARVNFGKLVLQQQKFTKTNFLAEAHAVWEGMVTFSEGNLLEKVVQKPIQSFPSLGLLTASFPDIKAAATEIEKISYAYERFYVTTDLEHLIRMQDKWGRDRFPIYQFDPSLRSSPKQTPLHHPKVQAMMAQKEIELPEDDQEELSIPWISYAPWLLAVVGWSLAGFMYLQPKPKVVDPQTIFLEWQLDTFGQPNKRDTLAILLQNVQLMRTDSSDKYRQAVLRDARVLKLDSITQEILLDTKR